MESPGRNIAFDYNDFWHCGAIFLTISGKEPTTNKKTIFSRRVV
jgi:hypothetical protein